ncbi:hypothetical protein [Streptomyces sp. NPDC053079]|uniref:hypothetical protein n=1 Tax=Streptomyces sp. NPDC053079 TaxID=3365697 RepID=UPI0037D65826
MPAQMPGFFPDPDGALRRLTDAVQGLHRAAGAPSYRKVCDRINRDDSFPATVSRQTLSDILCGRRLTQWTRLHSVVVQLLRMDKSQAGSEAEVLAQFESLWSAADREKNKRIALPDVPAARAFTARLRTLVLAPLTSVTDVSERLHHAGSRMSPGALANIAGGIRPPQRHELDVLLHVLAQEGLAPSPQDFQDLMRSYSATTPPPSTSSTWTTN